MWKGRGRMWCPHTHTYKKVTSTNQSTQVKIDFLSEGKIHKSFSCFSGRHRSPHVRKSNPKSPPKKYPRGFSCLFVWRIFPCGFFSFLPSNFCRSSHLTFTDKEGRPCHDVKTNTRNSHHSMAHRGSRSANFNRRRNIFKDFRTFFFTEEFLHGPSPLICGSPMVPTSVTHTCFYSVHSFNTRGFSVDNRKEKKKISIDDPNFWTHKKRRDLSSPPLSLT